MRVGQEMGQTWPRPAVALNPKGGNCLALPGGDTPPGTVVPGTGHPRGKQHTATTGREAGLGHAEGSTRHIQPAHTVSSWRCTVGSLLQWGPSCSGDPLAMPHWVPLATCHGVSLTMGSPFATGYLLQCPQLGPSCNGIPLAMSHGVPLATGSPLATPPPGPWTTPLPALVATTSSISPCFSSRLPGSPLSI